MTQTKTPVTEKYENIAVVIANMVYEYQGSDKEIQKKQVGKKYAGETLRETVEFKLKQRVKEAYKEAYKEGAKAGLQEGTERVVGLILEELDMAEQNKESADDLEDPKIRIKYLRDKLLKLEPIHET